MHSYIGRLAAALAMVLLACPGAFAQNGAVHIHQGTIGSPGGGAVLEVAYEISMLEEGHEGWIVGSAFGDDFRIEMRDLRMSTESVSYNWTPPGTDLIITCELGAVEDGGWSGQCIDNEEGDTGIMTMSPGEDRDEQEGP